MLGAPRPLCLGVDQAVVAELANGARNLFPGARGHVGRGATVITELAAAGGATVVAELAGSTLAVAPRRAIVPGPTALAIACRRVVV